jgi:hypothetical protein
MTRPIYYLVTRVFISERRNELFIITTSKSVAITKF